LNCNKLKKRRVNSPPIPHKRIINKEIKDSLDELNKFKKMRTKIIPNKRMVMIFPDLE